MRFSTASFNNLLFCCLHLILTRKSGKKNLDLQLELCVSSFIALKFKETRLPLNRWIHGQTGRASSHPMMPIQNIYTL